MTIRRNFLKQLIAGGILLPSAPQFLSGKERITSPPRIPDQSDIKEIRIALIGKGGMGTADTNTALSIEGIKLVAVCDLYDARLELAKQEWGNHLFVTKDYQEILKRKDVDVVLIGTPDHWHQPIAIAAMKAGKHVYCEKPVIHKISEGKALINAQRVSGAYFQAGSQGMASLGNRKARQLVQSGIIGKINFIDGQFTGGPRHLGHYSIPEDASEKTIWWKQFIGNAPKHDFDAQRFFYWRNWKDYGTGIAGDLYVHVLASLHFIMDAIGPEKVYTTGGIRYHTDGYRDTPDIMLGYFDYPDRNNTGAFTVQLGANLIDGVSKKWGSTNFRIVGSEGTLDVEWDKVTLKTFHPLDIQCLEALNKIGQGIDTPVQNSDTEYTFVAMPDYKGGHYDHFNNFFTGIRNKTPLTADVLFGVRSAAPALLSYESYMRGEAIYWDAENLKEIKKKK
ncbi:Gfo/Idh/MocA family protein [Parabacteroides chinchillae]|uniref:Predicted dehydrogenase n=1 Tax=Parabacteroides chinchillae TaxID=871327 RepID=A0A8G2BTM7_9BACT|nr:Gfo/Idh/MocA family oxidoreductase [Parabacteroides chinchillae]SEF42463.1 Predicted dehydrogenase [Parabacteroides chinchillae]